MDKKPSPLARRSLLIFIGVWLAFQVLFPLRHLLYPGSVSWTEEGHRFAWQMKLRDKKADVVFHVRDPATGAEWHVDPRHALASHQRSFIGRPDMLLQLAHHFEEQWATYWQVRDAEVRVYACVSLNGRPGQLMIDPERDLTKVERNLGHADWILPLTTPFERPTDRKRRRVISCTG